MKHEEIVIVKQKTTVVVGAGPYGLSVTAHLKGHGVPTQIFGKTMELWQNMPPQLCLKSIWSASTISDPAGDYTLDRYVSEYKLPKQEPVPLALFLSYAMWFQKHAVPEVDQTYVQALSVDGRGFHLDLADGRSVKAERVVLASGISSFAYVPDYARYLPQTLAGHTSAHTDLTVFKGRRVLVVGNGQSALEYAAMLYEEGADVEILARDVVKWHNKALWDKSGPARHLIYTPGDVGPPGINWLVAFPSLFSHFPEPIKKPVHSRAVSPGGARWLRPRIEGKIRITEKTQIVKATEQGQGQGLCLELSDGTEREVDFLMLGTGYVPSIHKLSYLDESLRRRIKETQGFPVLSGSYQSSVPNLFFAGILAGKTFGPTCRFVSGTKALAKRIAR